MKFVSVSGKKKIREWLACDQDYLTGVHLYQDYGTDEFLQAMFSHGETSFNRNKLLSALTDLAGDEQEPKEKTLDEVYTTLSRPFHTYPKTIQKIVQQATDLFHQARKMHYELKRNKRIISGFKEEQWPYLSADERKQNSLRIPQLFKENKLLWKQIQYYEETGEILAPMEASKYDELPKADSALILARNRLRCVISKWQKNLKEAVDEKRKNKSLGKLKEYRLQLEEVNRRLHEQGVV